jgi:hypothetical protein
MPDQRTLPGAPPANEPPRKRPGPAHPNVKKPPALGVKHATRCAALTGARRESLQVLRSTQLALVDVAGDKVRPIGEPALYIGASPSPGSHWSRRSTANNLTTYDRFLATSTCDATGKVKRIAASAAQSVPIWGQWPEEIPLAPPRRRRSCECSTAATGTTRFPARQGDGLKVPFADEPVELLAPSCAGGFM